MFVVNLCLKAYQYKLALAFTPAVLVEKVADVATYPRKLNKIYFEL